MRLSLLACVVGIATTLVVAGATAGPGNNSKLSKEDRAGLAVAGESTMLLIASKPGANAGVASAVQQLGGAVRYRDDALDYLRVRIASAKVDAASKLTGVQAVELGRTIPLPDPVPEADAGAVDPPGAGTPSQNAYMPTRDIGAPQFTAANPTFDGRGVTVGIVDSGVDIGHPALQDAKSLGGASVPKITDWVTATDPLDNDPVGGDPTWVSMVDQVSGASFTYATKTYTAPAAASYRIGLFNERDPRLAGEMGRDVNRDGNPAGSSGIFAVLWNTATNTVWVDTNQNQSFADEAGMTDFKVNRDSGVFGTDNPATAIREAIPFVVQTDGKNKYVNIGIVSSSHGTHVAGIAAGNDFFGGAYDGAAPEAQVKSVRVCLWIVGCTNFAITEGMIYLAKQAGADVINMSIGGLPALNDGNNTRALIFDRLIEQTKVQLFFSAGNSGPGINTVGDPSVASKVVSVGAYVHSDTWRDNYGGIATKTDGMFVFSSRGPAENGGFKPAISAPGAAVSSVPTWQNGQPVGGTYALPPGYAMFNGTSMASPQATGGAALLISAAKQSAAQYKPDQLRQAIMSSTRYLPAYGSHEQGTGLMQVGAAWNLLKQNIKTVGITASAPVNTAISDFLAVPDKGVGIYEREGWSPGQTGTRTITFTRTTGGSKAVSYNLSWQGNDGTFSSGGSIPLGLNKPTGLTVSINAATAGVHSAILRLDDPSTAGIDHQVMNTVVAAEQFAAPSYSVTRSGSADRPDKATFFFNVPAGAPAFQVSVTATNGGRLRVLRFHPYGVPIDGSSTPYQTGGTQSRTVANPQAGVWEVTVDNSRTSPVSTATFDVTGSVLGASVSPNPDTIPSATMGVPVARSYTLTNLFGAFTGRAVGTVLGSAFRATPSISTGEVREYPVAVTAGSTSLRATIGGTSDTAADLDLYVYNCTAAGGACTLAGQAADGDSEESVTIANPTAGNWKVVVDGYSVPAGTTTYNYIDVFANPAFGSVSVTDANALRPAGTSWNAPGSVTANAAPTAGRVLLGNVQVRTDTNVLVGQGDVIVQSVVAP